MILALQADRGGCADSVLVLQRTHCCCCSWGLRSMAAIWLKRGPQRLLRHVSSCAAAAAAAGQVLVEARRRVAKSGAAASRDAGAAEQEGAAVGGQWRRRLGRLRQQQGRVGAVCTVAQEARCRRQRLQGRWGAQTPCQMRPWLSTFL